MGALGIEVKDFRQLPVLSASAPDGSVIVGVAASPESELLGFTPEGFLDPGFGVGGRVRLGTSAAPFELAALAVDGQGRIVLAASGDSPGIIPTSIRLERLLPDGSPDPTFGTAGTAEPDFHIPGVISSFVSHDPTSATGLVLDSAGRIVLSGTAALSTGTHCLAYTEGFVARLGASGSLDPSFGSGGVVTFPSLATSGGVRLRGGEDPVVFGRGGCARSPRNGPAIFALESDGARDRSFGSGGRVTLGTGAVGLAVDSRGGVLFLDSGGGIHRLRFNGRPDKGFGKGGIAQLSLPGRRSGLVALTVTADGGILTTGVQAGRESKRAASPPRLAVGALTAAGDPRPDFGRGGIAVLANPPGTASLGGSVLATGSGALVSGPLADPTLATGKGVVLYRFPGL